MRKITFNSVAFLAFFSASAVNAAPALPLSLQEAQDQTIDVLQKLVRIDTSNPPGNEMKAAKFLKEYFDAAKIQSKIFESAPGRASLIARIKGNGSKKPILLVSHLDVVGVEKEHWSNDPFSGEIKDGRLYGRGSSDIKDLAAIHLEVMLLLQKTAAKLSRDIIFASVADEESGGVMGMQYLVENHWPEIEAEFAFNEGSRGKPYLVNGKIKWASLQVTERRSVNLKMVAHGTSAHSMLPMQDNALYALANGLHEISRYKPPLVLNPAIKAYIDGIAKMEHKPKDWYKKASAGDTEEARGLYAMLHTTINPTVMKGGFRNNVIPADAEANLNVRLLPTVTIESVVKDLEKMVHNPKISFEVGGKPSPTVPISSLNSEAVMAYIRAIHANFGNEVPFIPTVGAGSTDSRYLRAKGVQAYALEPFDDHAQNAHGNDESVSVDGVKNSVKLYFEMIKDLGDSRD